MCSPIGDDDLIGDVAVTTDSRGTFLPISEGEIDDNAEIPDDLLDGCLRVRPVEIGWDFTGTTRVKNCRMNGTDGDDKVGDVFHGSVGSWYWFESLYPLRFVLMSQGAFTY